MITTIATDKDRAKFVKRYYNITTFSDDVDSNLHFNRINSFHGINLYDTIDRSREIFTTDI